MKRKFFFLSLALAFFSNIAEASIIDAITEQISKTDYQTYVETLDGFGTRYYNKTGNTNAQNFIFQKLLSFGLDVALDDFSYNGTQYNVVATIPGTETPDEVYIIGAHYDSYSTNSVNFSIAPGADDNASGVAAVLEIASVLANYQFASTIKFILFDAEEQGLKGSWAYAQEARSRGEEIRAMLNFDMIAYTGGNQNEDVEVYGEQWLRDIMIRNITTYTSLPYQAWGPYAGGSDQYPFSSAKYPGSSSLLMIEGTPTEIYGGSNPYYHTTTDTSNRLDWNFASNITIAGAATIAELAQAAPEFGPDSAVIVSPYLPLEVGKRLNYVGTGTWVGYGHYIKPVSIEVIDAVNCLKVQVKGQGNAPNPDLDLKWYYLWLAQDTSGVVWLLQEYDAQLDTYRVLGKANAVVWMRANPVLGQKFAQDGSSYREAVETGVSVAMLSTGLGPYTGCVKVRWTDGVDQSFFYVAPNVGIVKEEWNGGGTKGWELQGIVSGISVSDELVADYGATYGLWHYDPVRGWTQLNTANAGQTLAVDINNDGAEELVVTFTGYGLYTYNQVSKVWVRINTTIPEAMIRLGSGVVCDFGSTYGLWYWDEAGGWKQWNTADAGQMMAVDINNDGAEELAVTFTGYGLYTYNPVTTVWVRINTVIPEAMNRLGIGGVWDFGSAYGLWYWDEAGGWKRWNTADAGQMMAVDINNDGAEELAVTFTGYGLYTYEPTTMVWIRINATLPDAMIRLGNGIACDFGTAYGLWYWTKTGGWTRWNTTDPGQMMVVDINNDGAEELVISFTGYGLYTYSPGTQVWVRINTVIPEDMKPVNSFK